MERLIRYLKKQSVNHLEGSLHVSHSAENPNYYVYLPMEISEKEGEDSPQMVRRYIPKKELPLAEGLAQKEYNLKILREAEQELHHVKRFLKNYHEENLVRIYEQLAAAKKKLVTPIVYPTDEYVQQWMDYHIDVVNTYPIPPGFVTLRGESVRSKSEVIIADTLNHYNIPYKYEFPLCLGENYYRFPDFTMLNTGKRKVYYWEHLGMMNREEYAMNNVDKIAEYIRHDIYPGENLILTYDGRGGNIPTDIVHKMIEKYLL